MKKVVLLTTVLAACAYHASETGTAELDSLLRGAIEQKRVPMAVAMVADREGVDFADVTDDGRITGLF